MKIREGWAALVGVSLLVTAVDPILGSPRQDAPRQLRRPAEGVASTPHSQGEDARVSNAPATAGPPVPIVLLRRSAKKAPDGSGTDVLVAADPARDPIAQRVTALMANRAGFSQFVLRLDRAVKTYLLADPSMDDARRRVLAEPAYFFLSDRQGGFPVEHFWLEMPDGSLLEKKDVQFVDSVVAERDLDPSSPDNVEAIYAHELAHLMMASLAGPAPKRATSETHFITVRTDAWTAFVEGFGEHMQPMALDYYPNAPWQPSRNQPMPQQIQDAYDRFAREQIEGCWICPANLTFLRWHGRGESWLRDGAVRANRFVWQVPWPERLGGDARPAGEARLYRDVMPVFGKSLKNGAQMLESEGVLATLFYRLASAPRLRGRYREPEFYARFLSALDRDRAVVEGIEAVVPPAENVYLKMFDVFHTSFKWGDWPAKELMKAYVARFPDEADALYEVFLDVTWGATIMSSDSIDPNPGSDLQEQLRRSLLPGALTKFTSVVDQQLRPPLWMSVPGFRMGMGLFRYFPIPNPYSFDLQAADVSDLRQVQGVDAELAWNIVRARARDNDGRMDSVEHLATIAGVTPELMARFRDMHARMVARLERPRPKTSEAGLWQNYLVLALRASYWLAAAWQYGRAIVLAGLAWLFVWWLGGRLTREARQALPERPGFWRRMGRAFRTIGRASLIASVPCLASVAMYQSGRLPTASAMAIVGLVLAGVWQGVRVAMGRESIDHLASHARSLAALAVAAAVIGGMY